MFVEFFEKKNVIKTKLIMMIYFWYNKYRFVLVKQV